MYLKVVRIARNTSAYLHLYIQMFRWIKQVFKKQKESWSKFVTWNWINLIYNQRQNLKKGMWVFASCLLALEVYILSFYSQNTFSSSPQSQYRNIRFPVQKRLQSSRICLWRPFALHTDGDKWKYPITSLFSVWFNYELVYIIFLVSAFKEEELALLRLPILFFHHS